MFIQVIQGRTNDAGELKESLDRWQRELAPGAEGWLGSTCGVTDDSTFICLARFGSPDAARHNSDRHEQGQWWAETSKLFESEVTFHDCTDVETFLRGGSDDAGFVQVIQGRIRDREGLRAFRERTRAVDQSMAELRPEVIGGVYCAHPDGGSTTAVYFTSEQAAREGERKELPPEIQEVWEEERTYYEGDFTYFDLHQPWLYSP